MFRYLRSIYRAVAAAFWTLAMILISLPYDLLGWKGRKRIASLLRAWARGVARICGIRVKIYGEPFAAEGGLVISNHLGFLDIIVHGTVFPLRFTSTTEIASLPVVGKIISLSHPVFVTRGASFSSKKASRDFAKTVRKGLYLIVYPEGTSTDGLNGVLPFKTTSFEAAARYDLPVIPLITRYREVPGRSTACWIGDMKFLPHLWELLSYPSIEAELHFMEPIRPEGRNRKELAEYAREKMDAECRRLVKEAESKEGKISIDPVTGMVSRITGD